MVAYLAGRAGTQAPVWIATRTGSGWTRTAATSDALTGRPGIAILGATIHLVGLLAEAGLDGELVHVSN